MTNHEQLILAISLSAGYCVWIVCLAIRQWSKKQQQNHIPENGYLIAYASQTGTAKQLAEQQAHQLADKYPIKLASLDEISLDILSKVTQAMFIVSTYGNGEPPDNGRRFSLALKRFLQDKKDHLLTSLSYRVIALGDSQYPQFCQFGDELNTTLHALGARRVQRLQRIDRADSQALIRSAAEHSEQQRSPSVWRVIARKQLNQGQGRELVEVTLAAEHSLPHWQAGDILDVQPHNSRQAIADWLKSHQIAPHTPIVINGMPQPIEQVLQVRKLDKLADSQGLSDQVRNLPLLPLRSYSVASVPAENALKLIVRKQYSGHGTPGLGSGWLTTFAQSDDLFCGYLKDNPSCHITANETPLLLIGAGSGLAGLRAQILQRISRNSDADIWLIFGEQTSQSDDVLASSMADWPSTSLQLTINKAFSRTEQGQYVQHILTEQADHIRNFVDRGAQIYVCGSFKGMGEAVHSTLQQVLGEDLFDDLLAQHRYHRDTY